MGLLIPVYLNQKAVFDLVAMSQGGIATLTKVTEEKSVDSLSDEIVTASFGLSDAFASLLKISLSGSKSNNSSTGSSKGIAEERVHTPASLFYNLRKRLIEEGVLQRDIGSLPQPGDFVEFQAILSRSPLVVGIDSIINILELAQVFNDQGASHKKRKPAQITEDQKLVNQFKSLSDSLQKGGSKDLIAQTISSSYRAVLTVEDQFLNDITMSDLVDGSFKVLGKVVRTVNEDTESINLLRKTPFAHSPDVMRTLLKAFDALDEEVFSLPEIQTEIFGPAIQVIPISIYS